MWRLHRRWEMIGINGFLGNSFLDTFSLLVLEFGWWLNSKNNSTVWRTQIIVKSVGYFLTDLHPDLQEFNWRIPTSFLSCHKWNPGGLMQFDFQLETTWTNQSYPRRSDGLGEADIGNLVSYAGADIHFSLYKPEVVGSCLLRHPLFVREQIAASL